MLFKTYSHINRCSRNNGLPVNTAQYAELQQTLFIYSETPGLGVKNTSFFRDGGGGGYFYFLLGTEDPEAAESRHPAGP